MSEAFYRAVRLAGGTIFRISSRPLVLHRERAARPGAWLLAANHESPFDAPLLIAATPRVIYWLSIVELFQNPFTRWFLSSMLAAPLDRSRTDTVTVRTIVRHLRAGRVVGLFPEGGLRPDEASVLRGGGIKDGLAKLAQLADVPVLPCVVVGGRRFHRWTSWLPLFRTRWVVAFGEPIFLKAGADREAARAELTAAIERALRALHEEVRACG
ncbi:MAG: 1-acyl-sn-glycerol-3-phosphate acyltransferase [Chthoniobacter sp.]|jgi:1-acyl-sn-glycerol-3-phosphate acyltransferase|nr:1-acyl-sn-glycerol-3-phosphate acyltransferase [Chthoniobacter sp.]